jgi:hypothetical protein
VFLTPCSEALLEKERPDSLKLDGGMLCTDIVRKIASLRPRFCGHSFAYVIKMIKQYSISEGVS